jgi:hypothetical protein
LARLARAYRRSVQSHSELETWSTKHASFPSRRMHRHRAILALGVVYGGLLLSEIPLHMYIRGHEMGLTSHAMYNLDLLTSANNTLS